MYLSLHILVLLIHIATTSKENTLLFVIVCSKKNCLFLQAMISIRVYTIKTIPRGILLADQLQIIATRQR
jgi:hypothetical protein